jgi:hypothetical protein
MTTILDEFDSAGLRFIGHVSQNAGPSEAKAAFCRWGYFEYFVSATNIPQCE